VTRRDVERFCRALARADRRPAGILLLGGAAAIVQSRARATQDVDLELSGEGGRRATPAQMKRLIVSLEAARQSVGIEFNYTEDASRWSMIPFLDYRNHMRLWKRFDSLAVYVLEPEYFALTKLARGTEIDVGDIRRVMRAKGGSGRALATLCGRALRQAPLSTAQGLFRRQVEHFFVSEGRAIWGGGFSPARAVRIFTRAAGLGESRRG